MFSTKTHGKTSSGDTHQMQAATAHVDVSLLACLLLVCSLQQSHHTLLHVDTCTLEVMYAVQACTAGLLAE